MSKKLVQTLNNLLDSCELLQLVDESTSCSNLLVKMGFTQKGDWSRIVKEFLLQNDVDISHFVTGGLPRKTPAYGICPVCNKKFNQPKSSKQNTTCSYSCSNTFFRSGKNNPNYKTEATLGTYRAKALKYYGNCCKKCSYSNIDALEVHHIDNNRNNNALENLEVLCANCHTLQHKL